jgi:hypothetical protein
MCPSGAGDADLDGVVSARDLLTLRRNLGASGDRAVWQNGDFNYDGKIGAYDYVLLRRNFGKQVSLAAPSGSYAPVPEPCALGLLFPLLALGLRRRAGKEKPCESRSLSSSSRF